MVPLFGVITVTLNHRGFAFGLLADVDTQQFVVSFALHW